jgi:hypothetical protein
VKRVAAVLVAVGVFGVLALCAAGAAPVSSATRWKPQQGLRWQYQLQGNVNVGICVKAWNATGLTNRPCVHPQVFDVDLYAGNGTSLNTAAVAQIHARHAHAVCYVDAGTWEDWRPDAARYPKALLGKGNGWPGEKWLDIRATKVLLPIIDARVAKCAKAGFDAVDYDNVEGYANSSGFPLTAADQLRFNQAIAGLAHKRGMAVGLKNDLAQLAALRTSFDFAVNEQCDAYRECGRYNAWTKAGKPVIEIEYTGLIKAYCLDAAAHGRDAIHKALALKDKPYIPCR